MEFAWFSLLGIGIPLDAATELAVLNGGLPALPVGLLTGDLMLIMAVGGLVVFYYCAERTEEYLVWFTKEFRGILIAAAAYYPSMLVLLLGPKVFLCLCPPTGRLVVELFDL